MVTTGTPILVWCEGSGCPPLRTTVIGDEYVGMCSMCGEFHALDDGDLLGHHQRDDVLARICRGDFDGSTAQSDEGVRGRDDADGAGGER